MNESKQIQKDNKGKTIYLWSIIDIRSLLKTLFEGKTFDLLLHCLLIKIHIGFKENSVIFDLFSCRMEICFTFAKLVHWNSKLHFNSFSTELPVIQKLLCKSVDWFLYDKDLRHERLERIYIMPALNVWKTQNHQRYFF